MEIVDQLLSLGSNFYWMLAGSLLVGMLLLAYVWREFAGWFFKVHEVLTEVRLLRDEVALLRTQVVSGKGGDTSPSVSPRVPYSPTMQSLDLVTSTKSPIFPTDHRGPAQETSAPHKPQFTLR